MAQQYEQLNIADRTETGGRSARSIRNSGLIPVNYYYKGEENINLTVIQNEFLKSMRSGHRIFKVDLKGSTQYVMVKEIQYHPVTDDVIHIDLMRVRRDEKMTISVSLELIGSSVGVKEGGVMMQNLTSIEISCLPADVPENITVDISDLELNANLNVEDLEISEELEVLTSGDISVVSCQPPKEEVEEEVEEELELEEGETPEGEEGKDESEEEKSEES
jgi:large subunit ribosomal protein L25